MNLRRRLSLCVLLLMSPLLFAQSAPSKAAKPAPAKTAPVTTAASPAAKSGELLDINTATPDQLMQLPGIGQAYAKRIVDGRPYTAKNQLSSRGIVPDSAYQKIAGQIIAKHAK